jgi:hypothetical protein
VVDIGNLRFELFIPKDGGGKVRIIWLMKDDY